MKVILLNGSPKLKHSCSGYLLAELAGLLGEDTEVVKLRAREEDLDPLHDAIQAAAALIVSFPLYVDSLPSHLISFLQSVEKAIEGGERSCKVYAFVNSGFYEPEQTALALDMVRFWCGRAGLDYGGGVGFGGGGMYAMLHNIPLGMGPKKNLGLALTEVADAVLEERELGELFVRPNIPRILYKTAAEMGWRKMAKANGWKKKDLSRRHTVQQK